MKNSTRLVLFFLPLFFSFALHAQQKLQIHQFGLGDGDCALIIIIDSTKGAGFTPSKLDTATILIDAQRSPAGDALLATVKAYLKDTLKRKVLDYVVVSHIHFDHYGGMLTVLKGLRRAGITIGNVYDRTSLSRDDLDAPNTGDAVDGDVCFDYDSINPSIVRSTAAKAYVKYVKDSLGGVKFIGLPSDLIAAKNFKNASMRCVAGYGASLIASGKGTISGAGYFIPKTPSSTKYKPKSENDLSFCFLITYQGFHYFTGGDIGGYTIGNYSDGETPIATFLSTFYGPNFHVCAMKISHHGSAHSCNDTIMKVLRPTISVFPAALKTYGRSKNPLPTKVAIDQVKKVKSTPFYTFVPTDSTAAGFYTKGAVKYLEDVSILIDSLPGTGTVSMHMVFRKRDPDTYDYVGDPQEFIIDCFKNHTF